MMVACLLHSLTFPPSPAATHNPHRTLEGTGPARALQKQRGPSFSSLGLLARDPTPLPIEATASQE